MSARSQLTRRSESEEAEDADEDKCTAKSDIVPALTWDGIEGLYTLHCARGIGCTVYNLTTSFHSAGKHPFSENPSLSSVPCRCMSVPTADWIRTIGDQGGKWRNEICMKMEFCESQLIRQGSLIPFQQKCMDKNIWKPTVNKSTCSILLILQKKGKILTSCTSPKTRWDHLGSCFPNEMFRGTTLKAA